MFSYLLVSLLDPTDRTMESLIGIGYLDQTNPKLVFLLDIAAFYFKCYGTSVVSVSVSRLKLCSYDAVLI